MPQELETALHQALWRHRGSLSTQPVDDGADAREVGIPHLVSGEVDALDQGAAVDPLLASMPALDGGRVRQVLPHIAHFRDNRR
jgi:hypothetical protein